MRIAREATNEAGRPCRFPPGLRARARICDTAARPADAQGHSDQKDKEDYRIRKQRYIDHLEHAAANTLLVSCADKLHNARAIVGDLRVMGPALFERFTGGREGTLWYYDELAKRFARRGPKHLAAELDRTVVAMKALAG